MPISDIMLSRSSSCVFSTRFINSGEILSLPGWPSNQTDIDRTIAIMQRMEAMFGKYPGVVPIIGALNE